jgi:hypothetical protein
MIKTMWVALALVLPLSFAPAANAAEVAGVQIPETAKVGNADLKLNGAGLRTRFVVKVYVGALYLPEKKSSAAEAMSSPGPKRISMHLLRDLTAEQLGSALDEGLNNNLPPEERERKKAQIEALRATMAAVGSAKEKSVITLDYLPDADATRLTLNGAQIGKTIPGEDFYRDLMKVWLGERPVEASLKSAMLGKG